MSDDLDSSEEELGLIEYENSFTRGIWLPEDPRLFLIFNGQKFIDYDDE